MNNQKISRIYLKSSQFQLISQQIDVDFLIFELLKRKGVHIFNIQQADDDEEDLSQIDQIQLCCPEYFIPDVIQLIFYDKLLDKYSLHHYQLLRVQRREARGPSQFFSPVRKTSHDLIEEIGVLKYLEMQHKTPITNPLNKYQISMSRMVRPLGYMNSPD